MPSPKPTVTLRGCMLLPFFTQTVLFLLLLLAVLVEASASLLLELLLSALSLPPAAGACPGRPSGFPVGRPSALNKSLVGVKFVADTGTTTSSLAAVMMVMSAVMPGKSFSSGLGADTI